MPDEMDYFESLTKTKPRATSSTAAAVKIINKLTKDASIGKYIVPIVPDEARTFGLETVFRGLDLFSGRSKLYARRYRHLNPIQGNKKWTSTARGNL